MVLQYLICQKAEKDGWIYLFQTIPANAELDNRPPVFAIQSGDAGDRLIIRSSESLPPK